VHSTALLALLSQLLSKRGDQPAPMLAELFKRCMSSRGVRCYGSKQFPELFRAAGIKPTVRALAKASYIAKRALRYWVIAFVKNEHRDTKQAELPGGLADLVEVFFHAISNKHHRVHTLPGCFFYGVSQEPTDLRHPPGTTYFRHVLQ